MQKPRSDQRMTLLKMSGSTELELPVSNDIPDFVPEAIADPPAREPTARERALEAIYASRSEVMRNELHLAKDIGFPVPVEPEAERIEDAPEAAPVAVEREVRAAPVVEAPVAQPAPVAAPTVHEIEIEGQRFAVDDAQLRELARMGALANLAVARQQYAQPEPVAPPAPAPVPEINASDIYQRIAYGSKEDGEAAVRDLAAQLSQRQPAVDPNQIAMAVEQRVRQQLTMESNLQTIAREYGEIFNDTSLSQFAALKLSEARQEFAARGIQKSDLDMYREACNRVRAVIGKQQPQSAVEQTQPVALQAAPSPDRLERKRAAPRNPTAVSRSAGVAIDAPRPPTNAEIVDRIRRSRGQPSVLN